MAYDSRAVKIKKEVKTLATMTMNKEKKNHFIREMTKVEERAGSARTSRNRGNKFE
jgi:hypothetical protein